MLERGLTAGIVCVQNAYSLVARQDEALLERCVANGIAWVPFFPLGGAFPGLPKVADEPAVARIAADLGVTPAQVGLAWLLAHAPDVLVIPGTSSIGHLAENVAVGSIELDAEQTAELDAVWEHRVADQPGRPPRP